MRLGGKMMIIGIKDLYKLFGIVIVAGCAVFVCSLFVNYSIDIRGIEEQITTEMAKIVYDAQLSMSQVIIAVTGGCLGLTSVVMLIFYVKNFVDTHGKELGILKALGYSNMSIAKHFWGFGLSVFVGCILGFLGSLLYLPTFYQAMNTDKMLPDITATLNVSALLILVIIPTIAFMLLSILYAYFKLKSPVLDLLREKREYNVKSPKRTTVSLSFLRDLQKATLKSRKSLVFFIGLSAFCFSAMTQMSFSMVDLSSETMAFMIISIGLVLAFIILFLSLENVVKANYKTIAMMKVFGYSRKECTKAVLNGYRFVSYIGFFIGTIYQYAILKIMVSVVFADYKDIPDYEFDFIIFAIMLVVFILVYELVMYLYSKKISSVSVKSIMLE